MALKPMDKLKMMIMGPASALPAAKAATKDAKPVKNSKPLAQTKAGSKGKGVGNPDSINPYKPRC